MLNRIIVVLCLISLSVPALVSAQWTSTKIVDDFTDEATVSVMYSNNAKLTIGVFCTLNKSGWIGIGIADSRIFRNGEVDIRIGTASAESFQFEDRDRFISLSGPEAVNLVDRMLSESSEIRVRVQGFSAGYVTETFSLSNFSEAMKEDSAYDCFES